MKTPTNDRDETIRRIRTALQRRSGKSWSVTGGRGTAWGWITIDAPPARRTWGYRVKSHIAADPFRQGAHHPPEDYEEYDTGEPGRCTSPVDRAELGKLLGLDGPTNPQGVSIASSSDYYREYIDRAEGRTPAKVAQPYWD